ncbi:hypothetical protein GTC6_05512 [Gordonia terrae C-6]|uniref:Uncharacterized protein n=1 Tax=Gordonia terrae C-6 TaxID=1316928 RepID=R7YDH8_9ACTN|nr:hypothetical protein [Gordonia terrae]EON33799.1 hypothetical protein GTC6_05512 [Gordonia terrae C-6]
MYEDDVQNLHRACDQVVDRSLRIEARAESIATEARELKHKAERIKHGNASYDDIVAVQSAADEMDHVLNGDLDRALDTLRSIIVGG